VWSGGALIGRLVKKFMPRININHLNIQEDKEPVSEKGPWSVHTSVREVGDIEVTKVFLFSDEVTLEISGDFYDLEQRLEYAELLVSRMNRMPEE
jgi:hypothetical protein